MPDNFKKRVNGTLITSKKSVLARLLLYQIYQKKGINNLETLQFSLKHNGKLFIENFPSFNISHCKDLVVVAYSKTNIDIEIGIDIEKHRSIANWSSLAEYFCKSEIKTIQNSETPEQKFIQIWTRKEAFYKAIGTGIHVKNSLKLFNSLSNVLIFNKQKWFTKTFSVSSLYSLSIVTNSNITCQFEKITYINLSESLQDTILL